MVQAEFVLQMLRYTAGVVCTYRNQLMLRDQLVDPRFVRQQLFFQTGARVPFNMPPSPKVLDGQGRDIEIFPEIFDDRARMEIPFMPVKLIAIEKINPGQFFRRQNRLEPFPDQRGQAFVLHDQYMLIALYAVQNEHDDIIDIALGFSCQVKDMAPRTVSDL